MYFLISIKDEIKVNLFKRSQKSEEEPRVYATF